MKKIIISAALTISAVGGIFAGAVAAQASQATNPAPNVQTVTIEPIVLTAGGSAGLH